VQVCGKLGEQTEKFLFYRGVASFEVPLSVMLEGEKVALKNAGRRKIAHLVVFENRGGRVGYRIVNSLRKIAVIERPALDGSIDELHQELKTILIAQGLYEKEAQAMIETWRDSWFEEGLRALYTFPRRATDQALPLLIEPAPAQLVRVMVGRAEIITPEMEREVEWIIASLKSSNENARAAALKQFEKRGRFAAPILKQVLEKTRDARSRALISQLITRSPAR
jgi:hypothetical protein